MFVCFLCCYMLFENCIGGGRAMRAPTIAESSTVLRKNAAGNVGAAIGRPQYKNNLII